MEKRDPKSKSSQATEDPAAATSEPNAVRILMDKHGKPIGAEIDGGVIDFAKYDTVEAIIIDGKLHKYPKPIKVAPYKQEVQVADPKTDFTHEAGPSLKTVLTAYGELFDAGKLTGLPVEESRENWARIEAKAKQTRAEVEALWASRKKKDTPS
jgi:hypothetical protein